MRILILIYEYPPIGGGGGRVAQDTGRRLSQRGHEVLVLTAHYSDLPFIEKDGEMMIYRLKSGRKQPFKAGLGAMAGFVFASLWNGGDIIRRWKPDLIHVHFAVPTGASAWALSMLTHTPYVLTAHLGDVPGGVPEKTGKWFRWIAPFTPPIWKRASAVVAVSEHTRRLALQHYPVPIDVIPNGVDLEAVDPGEITANTPPRLVFAGRFMAQKNLVTLVRSLAGLTELPWRCTLIGDGPTRPEVEQEIAACGLQDRFELPGWISPEAVLAEFGRSDILFMPSLSEGLPVTGVQAMAMGLAIVAGRAGGFVELVEPGINGYLEDPHDIAGFQHDLRALLVDPARLLAFRKASRRLAARYDLNRVVESYEQVFKRVKPDEA
jgi:L-malate glycosyltransferase